LLALNNQYTKYSIVIYIIIKHNTRLALIYYNNKICLCQVNSSISLME
jgi:hypothetical protein